MPQAIIIKANLKIFNYNFIEVSQELMSPFGFSSNVRDLLKFSIGLWLPRNYYSIANVMIYTMWIIKKFRLCIFECANIYFTRKSFLINKPWDTLTCVNFRQACIGEPTNFILRLLLIMILTLRIIQIYLFRHKRLSLQLYKIPRWHDYPPQMNSNLIVSFIKLSYHARQLTAAS